LAGVAGRIRIFNFEPGHDHGLHLVVLNEIFNVVCSDIFDKLYMWRECRRRVVMRCNREKKKETRQKREEKRGKTRKEHPE